MIAETARSTTDEEKSVGARVSDAQRAAAMAAVDHFRPGDGGPPVPRRRMGDGQRADVSAGSPG